MFHSAEIEGVDVKIDEFGHPKSLKETVEGAISRAKQAYEGHDYGFGIEGGLMEVPYSKSGYMEVAVCAIFDGTEVHLGLSEACEWPKEVIKGILNKGLDGSQAMKKAGITDQDKIGENKGFIHIVTKGRLDRIGYHKSAITMALIHLENPEHYN